MQLIIVLLISFSFISFAQEQTKPVVKYDVFSFDEEVTLPGTPEIIFDAVTGDINGWWDHSISENPKKFYIEPKPGGGFWEIFDDEEEAITSFSE